MSKEITIKFNITDSEDEQELRAMLDAVSMQCAIQEYDQWLRSILKHGGHTEHDDEIYQSARDKLYEVLAERNLSIT